jgi:hypothetical protein
MDGYERDGGDGDDHGREQNDDEPCGAAGGLWRGLSDPHGVDKGVRYELDELHDSSMVNWRDGSRNQCRRDVTAMAESEGFGVHLFIEGFESGLAGEWAGAYT